MNEVIRLVTELSNNIRQPHMFGTELSLDAISSLTLMLYIDSGKEALLNRISNPARAFAVTHYDNISS